MVDAHNNKHQVNNSSLGLLMEMVNNQMPRHQRSQDIMTSPLSYCDIVIYIVLTILSYLTNYMWPWLDKNSLNTLSFFSFLRETMYFTVVYLV